MDPATFATAYGLSTSVGLRPFLTLAIASLAMHFGFLHVSHAFAYLGTDRATWLLAALAALEFAGDKIPAVDHALHALHFGIKPVAAALLVGGAVGATGDGSTDLVTGVAMAASAFNAVGVHAGVTAARGASSAMTLGFANPFVSLLEDVAAFSATILTIALPFVGAAVALAIGCCAFLVARAALRALRGPAAVGVLRVPAIRS